MKVRRCVWGGAQLIVGVAVGMIGGRETVRFAACVSVCVTQYASVCTVPSYKKDLAHPDAGLFVALLVGGRF